MKAVFEKIKKFVTAHKVWSTVIAGVLVLSIVAAIFLPGILSLLSGKCKVTFETNGGAECATIYVEKGQPIAEDQLPLTTKDGYRFYGWFTDEALSLQYVDAAITNNITLYAGFSENKGPSDVDYPEVYIGTVEQDFAIAVVSSEKLTNDNVAEHIKLTVNYGKHDDGTPITFSVKENGQGKYLISANYAAPGSYAVSFISGAVSVDAENEEMAASGLSAVTQKVSFDTAGKNVDEVTYSDAYTQIDSSEILAYSETAIQVTSGATLSAGDVIEVPGANDFGFVKIVKEISKAEAQNAGVVLDNSGVSSKYYSVSRAEVNDVYDDMNVYKVEEVDPEQYITDEQLAQDIAETLKNDQSIDAFTTLLLQSATYTPEYQSLSGSGTVMNLSSTASVMPLAGTSGTASPTLGEIEIDPEISIENDPEFARKFNGYDDKDFLKVSLSIYRKSTLTRRAGADLVVSAKVTLTYYVNISSEGKWVKTDGFHDFRGGVVLGTHTTVDFEISLSVEEEEIDITESLRNKLQDLTDAEAQQVMSLYEALVPSDESQMVELYRRELFEAPVVNLYGFQLSIPADMVISVDFRVALSAEFSAMRLDKIGVEGNTGKLTEAVVYHEYSPTYTTYTVQIQGKIELRAGLEVGIELTFADIEDLGYIRLSAQAGVYVELHGIGYASNEISEAGVLGACGGAYYLEAGMYVSIDFKAEFFSLIGENANLWSYKYPMLEHGSKELVYGFANADANKEIIFGADGVYLKDITGLLDVYTYDITRERTEMERKDGSYMIGDYLTASFDNSMFKYDSGSGKLYLADWAIETAVNESATMVLRYEDYGLSFGECMTKTVKVRYVCDRMEDVDPELLSKTCTVTLKYDGIVCKTYEYPYGAKIADKYTLEKPNVIAIGKTAANDIPDEVYKKYSISAIEFESPGGYITEDIVLENGVPTEYVTRDYTFHYIDNTGGWASKVYTLKHHEVPDLSELEAACPDYMTFTGWSTEIVPNTFPCIDGYNPNDITARYSFSDSVAVTFLIADDVTMVDGQGHVIDTPEGRLFSNIVWTDSSGTAVDAYEFYLPYDEAYTHYLDYNAEKDGYNFIGWRCVSSTVDETEDQVYRAYTPYLPVSRNSSFCFEPVFEKKPYTITFKDGDKLTVESYNEGDVIYLPGMLWEDDSRIIGWNSEKDNAMHYRTYIVSGNDTLTSLYVDDWSFVLFDAGEGYFASTGTNCICMYVPKGETLENIETPVGYSADGISHVFSQWSTPVDQPINEDTGFAALYREDATLFAVTYDFDGGKLPEDAELPEGAVLSEDGTKLTVTVKEGENAPTIANPVLLTDDGREFEFKEWSPALAPVTADVTYKALYQETTIRFTVTFDLNGGQLPTGAKLPEGATMTADGKTITVSVKKGELAPDIEDPILIKGDGKNYVFVEWTPAYEPVNADITYKAVFEEIVEVGPGEDVDNPVDPGDVVGVHHKFENGVLTIYGTGKISNYLVDYEGQNVRPWDANYDKITKIVIEDGITYIGNHAFSYLPNLTTVKMADSVTSAGFACFMDCPKLTSLKLSNGIKCNQSTYDQTGGNDFSSMFAGCSSLSSITLPSGFERIPFQMFHSCTSLQTVNLPGNLKVIESGAFINCTSLKSMTLPDSLQTIEGYAFSGCSALESINVGANVTVEEDAFIDCPKLN